MTLPARLLASLLALPLTACISLDLPHDAVERSVTRSFPVAPHSVVRVALQGGSVSTTTGEAGTVEVTLIERVRSNSDSDIERLVANYEVILGKQDDEVVVTAKRRSDSNWRLFRSDQVNFSARIVVPADVRLNLGTSGGSITVRGDRTESLKGNTSGGSIKVDGGTGTIDVGTSGGSITIDRSLAALKVSTSGGSIKVGYLGPHATSADLSTSGGSIHVGVDPSAALDLSAGTSGGSVRVSGLPFENHESGRSHARGAINGGGGGHLHASTSGGNITIDAASN